NNSKVRLKFLSSVILLLFLFPVISCFDTSDFESGSEPGSGEGGVYLENKSHSSTSILASRFENGMPEVITRFEFSEDEIARVEAILKVDIESGMGMVVRFREIDVRLNYIIPENENELLALFNSLFNYAGVADHADPGEERHAVLLSGDIVYEIICADFYAGEAVRDTIEVDALQEIKLTAFNVGNEANLLADRVITGQDLVFESERIGFKLESAVEQQVELMNGELLPVYFYEPSDTISILDAAGKLEEYKGSGVGIFIIDNNLLLVETDDIETAEAVFRLVAIPPPTLYGLNRFKVRLGVMNLIPFEPDLSSNTISSPASDADRTFPLFTNWGRTHIETISEDEIEMIDDSLAIAGWDLFDRYSGFGTEITMTVPTGGLINESPEEPLPYLEPTPFWPSGSTLAKATLEEAFREREGDSTREQVEAIMNWVMENVSEPDEGTDPNSRSRLYVPIGSFEDLLENAGYSVWGRSDVFVTLSRSAGLRTRQVAGHVFSDELLVWSQVWAPEENTWLDVDTHYAQVGVDSLHIPIWGTLTGEMYFNYIAYPKIQRLY
ncbi:transglutaminase domain-containing protein, partial [bacterium]|nr:transglutaminase domain-containing protein [bacterium]